MPSSAMSERERLAALEQRTAAQYAAIMTARRIDMQSPGGRPLGYCDYETIEALLHYFGGTLDTSPFVVEPNLAEDRFDIERK